MPQPWLTVIDGALFLQEIAAYLISFDRHDEWLSCTLKTRYTSRSSPGFAETALVFILTSRWCSLSFRPKNGSVILYNRKKVKYRNDGYSWKKRKDGKTTREDHLKLKVKGMVVRFHLDPESKLLFRRITSVKVLHKGFLLCSQCLYGCYVHSSIVPTFHRRCYWLLQVTHTQLANEQWKRQLPSLHNQYLYLCNRTQTSCWSTI